MYLIVHCYARQLLSLLIECKSLNRIVVSYLNTNQESVTDVRFLSVSATAFI